MAYWRFDKFMNRGRFKMMCDRAIEVEKASGLRPLLSKTAIPLMSPGFDSVG